MSLFREAPRGGAPSRREKFPFVYCDAVIGRHGVLFLSAAVLVLLALGVTAANVSASSPPPPLAAPRAFSAHGGEGGSASDFFTPQFPDTIPDTTGRLQQDTTGLPPGVLPPGLPQKDSVFNPQDTVAGWQDSLGLESDTLFGRGRGRSGERDSSDLEEEPEAPEIDTTYVVYEDSTSRLAQFAHRRKDNPAADMFPHQPYALYLPVKSPAYKREMEVDSAGEHITIRERVNGLDVKVPVTMTVEEYIHARMEEEKRKNWRSFTTDYNKGKKADDLENLFGSITNIDIPVPSNPILSIFGGNSINLKTTGAVDIHAAFRNQTSDQVTQSYLDQSRNEPDFNQDVQINVNGTIGDKLNILADWNTQRTFEFENQLKLKYTGYDDEIVQSVEAGNVSLQTPSLVGGGQALFGIKTKMQAGPLSLTALLSLKKGQSKEVSISGGSQKKPKTIKVTDYATNSFFLDTLYLEFFDELHSEFNPTFTPEISEAQVSDIEVWVSLQSNTTTTGRGERLAIASVNLPYITKGQSYGEAYRVGVDTAGIRESGLFIKLDREKYTLDSRGSGYITISGTVSTDQIVAVAYQTVQNQNDPNDDHYYGEFLGSDSTGGGDASRPLILKMIKPKNLQSSHKPAWDLMLKNIYSLGGKDLKKEGLEVNMTYEVPGTSENDVFPPTGDKLLRVFGLDRFNESNIPSPDDLFDYIPGVTVDVANAAIMFPTLRPFDEGIRKYFRDKGEAVPESLLFSQLYTDTKLAAVQNPLANKYSIKTVAATAQSNRIPLGAFNIVEGSVQVLLNGSPLAVGTDYTVDYMGGEVVLNDRELPPNANVEVKYEQNDLFQVASKTLTGARGELDLFPRTKLGFTVMNLNQATLSDKVRLGEEPTNNTAFGVDGSTNFDAPFLTDLVDALPFFRTREMSTIKISGEGAYIIPDPNTKKSPVLSDGGASIAYIDDFEGARRAVPFNISYYTWSMSSPPVRYENGIRLADTTVVHSKARLYWYNNTRELDPVLVSDIWPNRSVRRGEDFVGVLNLDYHPGERGMYNFSPSLSSTVVNTPEDNWNGIMRYISTTAGNLIDQNINYLEIWVNAQSADIDDLRRGKLFVNLGNISEDVIPDGKLNSEDLIKTPQNPAGIINGVINDGEDLGIDMLSDDQEKDVHASFLSANPDASLGIDPSDPAGDNWSFTTNSTDFRRINGTENNSPLRGGQASPSGNRPESEDLNGNVRADGDNTYLEYEVPLDSVYIDSLAAEQKNPYIVGGGVNRWYQIRIPLEEPARLIASSVDQTPQTVLQNVQYVRLWLSGFSKPVKVRIAEMGLVGNQWLELLKKDSVLKVSVVNIEDSPTYAREWTQLGVSRERDNTQPDQDILANEQSMSLVLTELARGESRQAVKYFTARPLDIFNYKSMKMFVHGDPGFQFVDTSSYDAEIFLRFGNDTSNYYEYRQPIRPGWHPLNEIKINFSELSSIKAARDTGLGVVQLPVLDGPPGATYGIRGKPTLTQIRYLGVGVTNPVAKGSQQLLSGEVWVNELRVITVDDSPGFAYRFDTQVRLADLASVGANFSRRNPFFHNISDRFGGRINDTRWAVNSSVDFSKFFPESMEGSALSATYSHSEEIAKPRYLPGTDVLVDEAARRSGERSAGAGRSSSAADSVLRQSQTLRVQNSYAIPKLRIVLPWRWWLVDETFNRLNYSFSYAKADERNPTIEARRSWSWDFKMTYGLTVPAKFNSRPFKSLFAKVFLLDQYKDWKINFIPITDFSANLGSRRAASTEINRSRTAAPRASRAFTANKSLAFGWRLTEGGLLNLGGKYDLSMTRDLLPFDNDTIGRGFGAILKTMFFKGRDGTYTQRFSMTSKPKIPNLLNITKYFDMTLGYNVSYGRRNTFQKGDIGKSASWDNAISMNATFRLKSLTDPWFADAGTGKKAPGKNAPPPQAPPKKNPGDTTKSALPDSVKKEEETGGASPLALLKTVSKYAIKIPLLDYETISMDFKQGNRSSNGGVLGGTGFSNFWGRLPFTGSEVRYGPSRLYQLGLISDPSGRLEYAPSSSFPFIGWRTIRGPRPAFAQLSDQYSQSNNIGLRTNRPLWSGATLELNWKIGWQHSKNRSFTTDHLGQDSTGTFTTTGSVERSFVSLPPIFLFKVFGSGLESVGKKYDEYKGTMSRDAALAQAFEEGMEALPVFGKIFGQMFPRANWSIRWSGLEKISGLSSVFRQLSLDHTYHSSFRRDFRGTVDGTERTDAERVTSGFAPLMGLTMGFKEFLKGTLSGTFRFNSTSTYELNFSSQTIFETLAQEISLSLSYGRRGFNLPLFGINLSNDVDMTFTYSRTKNSRRSHQPSLLAGNQEGTPLEGSTRTTMEPRIRYVLSSRVSASLFFRHSRIDPDKGGSTLFGSTTSEGGLDIRISIQ